MPRSCWYITLVVCLLVPTLSFSYPSSDSAVTRSHGSTLSPQTSQSFSLGSRRESTFTLTARDTVVQLPNQFVIEGTEVVILDSVRLLSPRDYLLDARLGRIAFRPAVLEQLSRDTTIRSLRVRYQLLPFKLKERYQHRELIWKEDTVGGERKRVARPTSRFSVDELFSTNLQKSGSIVRGFSIGSNRDLSLTSGFRMQMAGKIASDVEVIAALSDENTPIQPEGNTQTLQEIDKVFVQVRSTDLSATLGDFSVEFTGNEFGRYNRKLQGAMGTANYRAGFADGSVIVSGAVTRGKFTTNQFQGVEGMQGPYRLTGQNNERNIIIVAGTEKVYVDGELMTRGETNDFTIDYASAELTFTSRRLISGASRIVVDFEYSDRQFTRSLVGAKAGTELFSNTVKLNATFIREADDPDSPIDVSLSDADKGVLRDAGGDRLKAVRSGVDSVGAGKGQYAAADTVINGAVIRFFRYAPADTGARYTVTFSYVGSGQGDYAKVSIGHYRYVGPGLGSYLPIRFLPMPQAQSLLDFDLSAALTDYLSISGEYAVSTSDVNRFSTLDDSDNKGVAAKYGLRFYPKNVKIAETNIGSFDLSYRERRVDSRFTAIDRTNDIEFNRKWNLEQSAKVDETIREGNLRYQPMPELTVGGGLGSIRRGDVFTSNRIEFTSALVTTSLSRVNYELEVISSRDQALDNRGRWMRQRGLAEYTVGVFTPGFRYEGEVRRVNSLQADTLKEGSFRYNEYAPRFRLSDLWGMTIASELEWREDDVFLSGAVARESNTLTQQYGWKLREWNTLSSSIDVTVRKKKYTEAFRLRGNSDIETTLLRLQARYSPLRRSMETEWFYEAASQRSSKLERVFVRVPRGTGNYRYIGDVNGNGINDEADFQLDRFEGEFIVVTVPSDELYPIVDLKASSRIRFTPSRLVTTESLLGRVLNAVSTETYVRFEEQSRDADTRSIYFLRFSHFMNEQNTIVGSNLFTQDLHIFENSRELSMRFRFSQRKGFTQFATASERSYSRERSTRLRWQLVEEVANQIDYINKNDRVSSLQPTTRSRDIASNMVLSDWSYRPVQQVELGFAVGVGRATDRDSVPGLVADMNNQSMRFVYSFQGRGQARVELQREEVSLTGTKFYVPFELTAGRVLGKTWLWRVAFDYRLTQSIHATLNYDGRREGEAEPIHSARAEVKAFF